MIYYIRNMTMILAFSGKEEYLDFINQIDLKYKMHL